MTFTFTSPVSLPGEFHGQRSLAGYTVHGVAKSWTPLTLWFFHSKYQTRFLRREGFKAKSEGGNGLGLEEGYPLRVRQKREEMGEMVEVREGENMELALNDLNLGCSVGIDFNWAKLW